MNLAQAQSLRDNSFDVIAENNARLETKEAAIRQRIENDQELFAEAVSDYYDASRVELDGHDLLTEFTLALVGAEKLMDAIAHGGELPDSELQAFRALCRQIEEAKRRAAAAVDDAVAVEMLT